MFVSVAASLTVNWTSSFRTPEATLAACEKPLPGVGELMRQRGRDSNLRAALSRGVAAVRAKCLVVNLPGSPRGAVESLDAILELVPHVLDLLRGQTAHDAGSMET